MVVIADTIFQDLDWTDAPVPEIFALADRPDDLVKICGPSKDRPFSSGHRVGYAMADRRLLPWLERTKAITENTSPAASRIWLAFESVFRAALYDNSLTHADCEHLAGRFLFGYGTVELSADRIRQVIEDSQLFEAYSAGVRLVKLEVRAIMQRVHAYLAASECFAPLPLPDYGNLLMFKVRPPFDRGDESRFFLESLVHTGVTGLTGQCFGMEKSEGVWGRVSAAYYPAETICAGLDRLQAFLVQGASRRARMTAGASA